MLLGLFVASLVLSTHNTGPYTAVALSPETQHIATIIGIFPSVAGTGGDAAARNYGGSRGGGSGGGGRSGGGERVSSLPLEPAAVERATTRSRGNPLFALQLLHACPPGGPFPGIEAAADATHVFQSCAGFHAHQQ